MSIELSFTIGTYTVAIAWYWLMALSIVAITTLAGLYHKKAEPIVWGWTMGLILYFGHTYIESTLFGWTGYSRSDPVIWCLFIGLALLFLLQMAILLYNSIKSGVMWGMIGTKKATPLLAILSILMLLIPAITLYGVDAYSLDIIETDLSADWANMGTGEYLNSYEEEKNTVYARAVYTAFTGQSKLPFLQQHDTIRLRWIFPALELGINANTLDNTNLVLDNHEVASAQADWSFYLLDERVYNVSDMDALKITTSLNSDYQPTTARWGLTWVDEGTLTFQTYYYTDAIPSTSNGTFFFPISLATKLNMLAGDDGRLMFFYYTPAGTTDEEDFDFKIEIMERIDSQSISPIIILKIILGAWLVVGILMTAFATDVFDVKVKKGWWN